MYLVFIGSQLLQAHGASGMQLLGADTDFCAKSKLETVCKSCGGIDINTG